MGAHCKRRVMCSSSQGFLGGNLIASVLIVLGKISWENFSRKMFPIDVLRPRPGLLSFWGLL